MNPYLLTICFLTVMSLLTSSELTRFAMHFQENEAFKYAENEKEKIQEVVALNKLDLFMQHEAPPTTIEPIEPKIIEETKKPRKKREYRRIVPSLNINLDRPPNNSRLNLYLLEHSEKLKIKKEVAYEIAARLIRILYEAAYFFEPGCEYLVLDEVLNNKNLEACTWPDDLAALTFDDPKIQRIFYLMLKGEDSTFPLLHFIEFDKNVKSRGRSLQINLFFASPLLLKAIFNNDPLTQKIIDIRERIMAEIICQEESRKNLDKENARGRRDFSQRFQEECCFAFNDYHFETEEYLKFLDFTLGESGDTLFILDETTGIFKRERLATKRKTSSHAEKN